MNLNQVTVGVSDIPRARAFYQKLGLELIVSSDHYARFFVQAARPSRSISPRPPRR